MDEDSDHSDLTARLEKALEQSRLDDPKLRPKISVLLRRSVEFGRARRMVGDNPDDDSCREHVATVIECYQKHNAHISALERGDQEAWAITLRNIRMWANGYFKNHNVYGDLRKQCLDECVPNAVLAYLTSTYHYDTDYEAWFCVLVQNVCRRHIREQLNLNQAIEQDALSYDRFELFLEALADEAEATSQKSRELRSLLLEAVEKLSSKSRQKLILLYYFEGYSFKEIAAEMQKSLNAVYKMHFDSLNELRDKLNNWY